VTGRDTPRPLRPAIVLAGRRWILTAAAIAGALALAGAVRQHAPAAEGPAPAPPFATAAIAARESRLTDRFQLAGPAAVRLLDGTPQVLRYDARVSDRPGWQEWQMVRSAWQPTPGRWRDHPLFSAAGLHDPPVTALSTSGRTLAVVDQPPIGDRAASVGRVMLLPQATTLPGSFTVAGWHVDALAVVDGLPGQSRLLGLVEEQNRADHGGAYRWRLVRYGLDGRWSTLGSGPIRPLVEIGPQVGVAYAATRIVVTWRQPAEDEDDIGSTAGAYLEDGRWHAIQQPGEGIVVDEPPGGSSLVSTPTGAVHVVLRHVTDGRLQPAVLAGDRWRPNGSPLGPPAGSSAACAMAATDRGVEVAALTQLHGETSLALYGLEGASWRRLASVRDPGPRAQPAILPGGCLISPGGGRVFYLRLGPAAAGDHEQLMLASAAGR